MNANEKTRSPLVCHNKPFVGNERVAYTPFIRINRPFIGKGVFSGFSMIELAVAMTIAAILAAIGIPSIGQFLEANRQVTLINDLVSDINAARAEAIKRGTQVAICESSSGTACTTTGDWKVGWMVYADADNSGTYSTGDAVVRAHETVPVNHTITGGPNQFIYNRLGLRVDNAATTFTVCNSKLAKTRVVSVTNTGRASTGTTQGSC